MPATRPAAGVEGRTSAPLLSLPALEGLAANMILMVPNRLCGIGVCPYGFKAWGCAFGTVPFLAGRQI